MSTFTDGIRGKVWEVLVDDRRADEYSRRFCVVNLHHENNKVRLRIVDEAAPAADAYTVEPSLEDLFLYHFGEEAQILQYQTYNADGVIKGLDGIAYTKEQYSQISVPLTDEYISETIREVQELFENPDNVVTEQISF